MKGLVASLALAIATNVVESQRPDFSGTWVRVVDSAAARPSVATAGDAAFRRGDMGSGWGSPLTITQRADSLIVEYVFFSAYDLQPPVRLAYAMDGSESHNSTMLSHSEAKTTARLAWRDRGFVVTTRYPAPPGVAGGALDVTQVVTLTSPTSLVIETTRGASTTRTPYSKR